MIGGYNFRVNHIENSDVIMVDQLDTLLFIVDLIKAFLTEGGRNTFRVAQIRELL